MFFYSYFYEKNFKDYDEIDLSETNRAKVIEIIDKASKNRNKFLNLLDKTLLISIIVFALIIVIIAIFQSFNVDLNGLKNQLYKYSKWHNELPYYFSAILPSVIVNNFLFKKTYFLISIVLLIILRVISLLFQYRNFNYTEDDLFEIIVKDSFEMSNSFEDFDIDDYNEILSLPEYNNYIYCKDIYQVTSNNGSGIITEINLYGNKNKKNILSLLYLKINLNFFHEDFKFNISGNNQSFDLTNKNEIFDITKSLKKNIVNLDKYRKHIVRFYLDDLIKEQFTKKSKYFPTNFPIKYICHNNRLFVVLAKSEELFDKKSLFTQALRKSDIVLLNEFCKSVIKIIEIMKKNEKTL